MEDLSLHILDIAENSISAGARNLRIVVIEDVPSDLLCIEIADDGKGMPPEVAKQADDPFYTTRTTRRVGLGLALLREATVMAHGTMNIHSAPGSGTTIRATFQLSHIDRKPLGNMADTITALLATGAEINIRYKHIRDGKAVEFDAKEIQDQLGDTPLSSIEALNVIRGYLNHEEQILAQ